MGVILHSLVSTGRVDVLHEFLVIKGDGDQKGVRVLVELAVDVQGRLQESCVLGVGNIRNAT